MQDNALDIRVRDFVQLPSYPGMPTPFKAITLKSLEYEPKMPNFPLKLGIIKKGHKFGSKLVTFTKGHKFKLVTF